MAQDIAQHEGTGFNPLYCKFSNSNIHFHFYFSHLNCGG